MTRARLPISVIVMTKNNAQTLPQCLTALVSFDRVWVVDSFSTDGTEEVAKSFHNVTYVQFRWNGQYPKKKQWCLNYLSEANCVTDDWVLMVDADEIVSLAFIQALNKLFEKPIRHDGYFVKSKQLLEGRVLQYGQQNKKLALFKRNKFQYPVLKDIFSEGSFEVEGHYQPIKQDKTSSVGVINAPIYHLNTAHLNDYETSHDRYILWEADMTRYNLWPDDPVLWRQWVKQFLRFSGLRAYCVFVYSFIIRLGFLDGYMGFKWAKMRYDYYAAIQKRLNDL